MTHQKANEPNHNSNPSFTIPQSSQGEQDFFCFLRREKPLKPHPFFSENGLSQDILQVTGAEPDICLEVFYALYNTLRPQLEKLNERKKLGMEEHKLIAFLQDAWTNFVGFPGFRGVLWPPEKLMDDAQDVKASFLRNEGERHVFRHLDAVVNLVSNLKKKLEDYSGEIFQREEILTSLQLVQEFYAEFRSKVIGFVTMIFENNDPLTNYHALESLLEPKAVMMSDTFSHHWAYRISRKKAQKLLSLDKWRDPMKNYSDEASTNRVAALPEKNEAPEPLVYFKANGGTHIQPEKEFMLFSLYRQLQIPVPETALLVLTNVFVEDPDYYYAVQASEAVIGTSAFEACKNPATTLEQEAYALQVIGAFLTNPSDGSFKNFKYCLKKKTLVGIDNDLVFEPELAGYDGKKVNVRSILYLLPLMDHPVSGAIRTFFTTIDPHLMISVWLRDLQKKNQEYELLFTRLSYQRTRYKYQLLLSGNEKPSLSAWVQEKVLVNPKSDNAKKPFYPQVFISKNLLKSLTAKLRTIRTVLENNHSTSPQILFEVICPILSIYYRRLRGKFRDSKIALSAVWGDDIINGVNYSSVLSLLSPAELSKPTQKEIIPADEMKNLQPEDFFEEYKKALSSDPAQTPLDKFSKHQSERKTNGLTLDFHQILKELQLLVQEGLTHSKSLRDIVEFWYDISKISQDNKTIEEIRLLLSNLPDTELKWLFTLEKHFLRPGDLASKPYPIAVDGAFMKKRTFYLTEFEKYLVFDGQGDIRKNVSLAGRSRVTSFPHKNPEFYLKQYPEFPGYEYASVLFMRLLGVTRLPYQDLLIINSKYPVLLAQAIDGNPVFKVWDNPQAFNNLDPFHTGVLIIAAMLINPEDGKEDNFILSQDGRFLIPIDNDHCFLPSTFQKEGSFWNAWTANTALQTKTLLFCLDEMNKPVPLEVRKHILSINFNLLLTSWMTELIKVEDRYHYLVNQEERYVFFKNGTVLRVPFYEQFIHNLYWKTNKIQDLLRSSLEQTPLSLLKAVEPFAAKCYQDSFQHENTLQSRFKAATNKLFLETKTNINGSRVSILNTRSMMKIINISEQDLQNDLEFNKVGPSDVLKCLIQLIQDQSKNRKMEQDLLCELDHSNQERRIISLFGKSPAEEALKDFIANPKEGLLLKGSKYITSSKLKDLFALAPGAGVKIRFLSLPNSPLLGPKEIRILVKECPHIEYLNVSGCEELNEIVTKKEEWPLLTRLEAQNCPILKRLVSSSPMKILRIETEGTMEIFVAKSTLDIFTISFRKNHFTLTLKNRETFEIKIWGQTLLSENFLHLIIHEKALDEYFKRMKITIGTYTIFSVKDLRILVSQISLRNSNTLTSEIQRVVELGLRNLKRIDMAKNGKIKGRSLQYLIQGDWPELNHLDLSCTQIDDEDMKILARGNWPSLETLNLKGTTVTKKRLFGLLGHANWPNLKEIIFDPTCYLNWNSVKAFSCPNWSQLEELNLSEMKISQDEIEIVVNKFNFPQRISLNEIHKERIALPSEEDKPRLKILNLRKTEITGMELKTIVNKWKLFQLKQLDISQNLIFDEGIMILSQGSWSELEVLKLQNIKITAVGVEALVNQCNWPTIKHLNLSDNEIKDEGLEKLLKGKWSSFETLNLRKTKITTAGIKILVEKCNLSHFKDLNISKNCIDDEGLQVLYHEEWPSLENLNLDGTEITEKGLLNFLLNKNWSNLQKVVFYSKGINIANCLSQKNQSGVENLDLSCCKITIHELETIVKKRKWFQLKRLNLSSNSEIDDEALRTLAQGDWPLLETLNLCEAKITKRGLLDLLLKASWPHLKEIIFPNDCRVVDRNLEFSFFQKDLSQVTRLELNNLKISLSEIDLILDTYQCSRLKSLNLSDNDISFGCVSVSVLPTCPEVEELHIENIRITLKEIKEIVHQSKWSQLKFLNISNNDIFDDGLSALPLINWPLLEELHIKNIKITSQGTKILAKEMKLPRLKVLDVSENAILDEGLEMIASGNWDLFERLIYYNTKVTHKGSIALLEKFQWPNFHSLEHSLSESFFDFKKFSPEIILAMVPMSCPNRCSLVIVFDTTWLHSKELDLLVNDDGLKQNVMILPREKLCQVEHIWLSPDFSSIPYIVWPFNLKSLNIFHNSLFEEENLNKLFLKNFPPLESLDIRCIQNTIQGLKAMINKSDWSNLKNLAVSESPISKEGFEVLALLDCPLLESLNLSETLLTFEGAKVLFKKTDWLHLKELNVSRNPIQNDGFKVIVSLNCPLLEYINLERADLTLESMKNLINRSDWQNLKELNISGNQIQNKGLKVLTFAKWHCLESLNIRETSITGEGIEVLINRSDWPNLRIMDVSGNKIQNEGPKILASGKWEMLEYLNLQNTEMTSEGVEFLIRKESFSLKQLNISENPIRDKGLKLLSSGKWPLLEYLHLGQTQITEKGIESMVSISKWKNLKRLDDSSRRLISEKKLENLVFEKWPLLNKYPYL